MQKPREKRVRRASNWLVESSLLCCQPQDWAFSGFQLVENCGVEFMTSILFSAGKVLLFFAIGSKMSNPEQSTTKFLPSWDFCKPCQSGGEERYAQGWSAGQETLKSKVGARKPRVRGKQPGPHRWTVSNRIAHVASQTP